MSSTPTSKSGSSGLGLPGFKGVRSEDEGGEEAGSKLDGGCWTVALTSSRSVGKGASQGPGGGQSGGEGPPVEPSRLLNRELFHEKF